MSSPSSSSFELQPSSSESARLLASATKEPQTDTMRSFKPSVQSDDVLVADQRLSSASSGQSTNGDSIGGEQSVASSQARQSGRPRRPSLGFSSQGARNKHITKAQLDNQAELQSSNTINGIRRPGLVTTSTAPSSSETATPQPPSQAPTDSGPVFPQGRLTSASARLRNRFKKPSSGSNGTLPVAQSMALVRPLGGGGEEANSDQLAVSSPPINPESQSSLQARIGDVFNPGAQVGISPVVGSDEILAAAPSRQSSSGSNQQEEDASRQQGSSSSSQPSVGADDESSKLLSRSGEQRPRDGAQFLSGGLSGPIDLQQGQLSNVPINFDGFFQSDQPSGQPTAESSEHHANHYTKEAPKISKNNNERLNGWLDQHNNKYVPRPNTQHESGHLSQQLASTLNNLAPSFSSNIPAGAIVKPTPVNNAANQIETLKPAVGSLDELEPRRAANSSSMTVLPITTSDTNDTQIQLQTITKTYSTVMTTFKTRLVPLQVKSSTAIHTITENYVITKMLTAYQTMPVGEFILPEPSSTRAPFEMFNELSGDQTSADKTAREQPISAPSNHVSAPIESQAAPSQQEQPIGLDTSPKSANNWLHDFSNLDSANQQQPQQQASSPLNLAALLEQQAQEANLAGFPLGEPLDQLASSLDPSALLADGTINIPDLNNPLVLAAAIQNPQLAAVILAAQQLQLKQQRAKLSPTNQQQQQQQQLLQAQAAHQLQPSYSTSLSTTVKPSTYTVRDTMYTTRLVSFKDGRTVRTRTVSEPGSVIEQVLTTMATEVTPVTITIRPTGMLQAPLATLSSGQQFSNPSQTLNNALFATQLASILARRQQQVQPSMQSGGFMGAGPGGQLAALQQLIGQQQQQQQRQQAAKQFQPNIQQLLQSMQQQQPASSPTLAASGKPSVGERGRAQEAANEPTPPLPAPPMAAAGANQAAISQPLVTTLTSLQVRTYTVHNAFKTIYRTITSTQLITSTLLPATRNTQVPNVG